MKRRLTALFSLLLLIILFPTAIKAAGSKTIHLNFGSGHEVTAQHYADSLMSSEDYVLSREFSGTVLTLTVDADAVKDKTVQELQDTIMSQLDDYMEEDGTFLFSFVQNSDPDVYSEDGLEVDTRKELPVQDTLNLYGYYKKPLREFAINVVPLVYGSTITLPKPSRKGYAFDYWKGSRYKAGASYKVEGDHTLTAQWKKTTPNTGDHNRILLYSGLLIVCIGAVLYVAKRMLKRN
jgi:LPXTG-motif cell wall-anchored protein